MLEIIYPLELTYYIAWDGDVVSYGVNNIDQQTTTGLSNLETFTDETLYLARLLEFGITPTED